MPAHTRVSDRTPYCADAPSVFKNALRAKDKGEGFASARQVIWRRRAALSAVVSHTIATQFKMDLNPFPSHFVFHGVAFAMVEPDFLSNCSRREKKSPTYVKGAIDAYLAQGRMDFFASLVIGLSTAQKIPAESHWALLDDPALDENSEPFSETDTDTDDAPE